MDHKIPPPPAPLCLERRYPSSQKGGTLIASDVLDRAIHAQRMLKPDSYRPVRCLNCHCRSLHIHDRPWRVIRGEREVAGVEILRFICVLCKATWRIVPCFLARHLWRTWETVETAVGMRERSTRQQAIPERTVRRWKCRLQAGAGQLGEALRDCARATVATAARGVGLLATRLQMVSAVGSGLATVAAVVHESAAGVRVV